MKPPYLLQSSMPLLCSLPPIRHRAEDHEDLPEELEVSSFFVEVNDRGSTAAARNYSQRLGEKAAGWKLYLKEGCQKAPSKLFRWRERVLTLSSLAVCEGLLKKSSEVGVARCGQRLARAKSHHCCLGSAGSRVRVGSSIDQT